MPDVGGGDLFSDLLKAKGTEPSLTSADNSLSRALFCLQMILTTAWTVGGCAGLLLLLHHNHRRHHRHHSLLLLFHHLHLRNHHHHQVRASACTAWS